LSEPLGKKMGKKRIQDIMIPPKQGLPQKPSLAPEERITDAVAFMLEKNIKEILVSRKGTILGMVRLEDIFKEMGLHK